VHTLLTGDEEISVSVDFKSHRLYFVVLSMWIMELYITDYCIIPLEHIRHMNLPCSKTVCVKNKKFVVILALK
jgi:hypothetical protein